ncbi:MAG: CHAP domain-containing protein [Ruminococcus sp.]|nr:CHAP domain-containing protein [Ruminococcus sp.]
MAFTMRTTKPKKGNKYYTRKVNGGYSNAIKGYPADPDCDVLSNCVGYAYGRFNEIGGYGCCKYLAPVNAEKFMQYKGSCNTGQTPKVGACMVWSKGSTQTGSDGAGHVAIVEKVVSATEVITSESGYGNKNPFWNQTRKQGSNGNWGCGTSYKFLGFIYNPAVADEAKTTTTKTTADKFFPERGYFKLGDVSANVGKISTFMRKVFPSYTNAKAVGNTYGPNIIAAVKEFQNRSGLKADGYFGPLTLAALEKHGFKK